MNGKVEPTMVLNDKYIGAGTDPGTGLPVVHLDGITALGVEVPDQRYRIEPETARKVGAQLVLAASPELAAGLVAALAGARFPTNGFESVREVSVGYTVDPTKVVHEGDQTFIPNEALQRMEEQARQAFASADPCAVPAQIVLQNACRTIATSIDGGMTWTHVSTSAVRDVPPEEYVSSQAFAERAAPTLPPELSGAAPILEGLGEALAHAQGEDIGATEWRWGPAMPLHDGGTLTAEAMGGRAAPLLSVGWALLSWRRESDCYMLIAVYDPQRTGRLAVGRWALHEDGAWSCEEGWSSDGETLPQVPPLREG